MASRVIPNSEFRGALAARGLRATWPRLAVLRELATATAPVSHRELAERLEASGLDRVTVYRNLVALTNEGLLVRVQLADRLARYQLAGSQSSNHDRHPHWVCVECGRVCCLSERAVKLASGPIPGTVLEVQIRGRCADCSKS